MIALAVLRPGLLRVLSWRSARPGPNWRDSIGVYHALWVLSILLNGASIAVVMIYTFPTFTATVGYGCTVWRAHSLAAGIGAGDRPIRLCLGTSLRSGTLRAVLRVSWLGTLVTSPPAWRMQGMWPYSQRSVQNTSPWTSLTC
ncbi:MAG: hypothetical protein U0074_02790 [Kouleothrix sp.]